MSSYKIKHGSSEVVQTTVFSFDYIEIKPDMFAYRWNSKTSASTALLDGVTDGKTGVTNHEGLERLRVGVVPNDLPGWCFVTDALYDALLRFGYTAISRSEYRTDLSGKVFAALKKGRPLDRLLHFNSYDHSIHRLDGTLLPSAEYFDYIQARMHDGCYDLDKAIAILRERDDVTFVDDRGDASEPRIMAVPGYNRSDEHRNYINFFFSPNQEQADLLRLEHVDRYRVIFDRDMLGLRTGGAARVKEFYDTVYLGSDEDDD